MVLNTLLPDRFCFSRVSCRKKKRREGWRRSQSDWLLCRAELAVVVQGGAGCRLAVSAHAPVSGLYISCRLMVLQTLLPDRFCFTRVSCRKKKKKEE